MKRVCPEKGWREDEEEEEERDNPLPKHHV